MFIKRSFRGLLAVAVLACVSAFAVVERGVDAVVSAAYRVRDGLKALALGAIQTVAPEPTGSHAPTVRRVQAKAFQARIDKRERPVITNTWRLCPSV